ncbi:MAG: response regulator [Acidimicrobiales bacterium]
MTEIPAEPTKRTPVIRVLLVDDHPVVRDGLAAILASESEFQVVGQASTGEEALEIVAGGQIPDVVILDVRLPDMSGIALCSTLRQRAPRVRAIVFTSFPSDATMLEAFTAGAKGFLAKESHADSLRQAVRIVAAGATFIDPRLANKLVALATRGRRAKGPYGLTMQEMRVLELLPRGFSNAQIGRELGVSEQTIKTHLYSAMRKLNVSNRTEASTFARREGLA